MASVTATRGPRDRSKRGPHDTGDKSRRVLTARIEQLVPRDCDSNLTVVCLFGTRFGFLLFI